MKATKNLFAKITQFTILALCVLFTQSCETDIPPEDATPPEFSFHITGGDFDHTFTQDSDFDNIRLKLGSNTTYNFTFTGTDAGGVQLIQWKIMEDGYITIATEIPTPWTSNYRNSNKEIEWRGDESNPYTGSVLTGNLSSQAFRTFLVFSFGVTDFGGESGPVNRVVKELSISTGNSHHGIKHL